MNIKTLENLFDHLDGDFAWRKKELSIIDTNVNSEAKKSNFKQTPALSFYLRAGIALLYAHWEGFIKNSMHAYLDYISNQRIEFSKLNSHFIVLGLRGKISALGESGKVEQQLGMLNFILNQQNEIAFIPKNSLRTKSNLSAGLFIEIVKSLNLKTKMFELKEKLIDENLLKARNQIAHGEFYKIQDEVKSYNELHMAVIEMLTDFKNEITIAAVTKTYLQKM
jgi:hypothetical protein